MENIANENNINNNVSAPAEGTGNVNNAPQNGAYANSPATPQYNNPKNQGAYNNANMYTQNTYAPPYCNAPSYTVPNTNPYGYNVPPFGYTPPVYPNSYYPQSGCNQSPISVYNNAQNGSAPQYHYGYGTPTPFVNTAYYREQQEKLYIRRNAEKTMSKVGNISGFVLLGSLAVSLLFSIPLFIPAVEEFMNSSLSVTSLFNLLYTVISVGLAIFLFSKLYKNLNKPALPGQVLQNKPKEFKTSFSKPKDLYQAFLLIVIAFGGCMLANFLSSIVLTLLETIGVHSTYTSTNDPKNISDIIMMFISVAVIPALIEELALRGVVMSNLRKYGNTFAIIASAFMFGIFHGTAAQILFAFICGLFFGYITIATQSIWPAIIVHALNNSLSCITSVLLQVTDDSTANIFFYLFSIGGMVLALIAVLLYAKTYNKVKVLDFKGEEACLTTGQKFRRFVLSPSMIVVIVFYTISALGTLKFG